MSLLRVYDWIIIAVIIICLACCKIDAPLDGKQHHYLFPLLIFISINSVLVQLSVKSPKHFK